jgi:hypothetical protein
MMQVIPGKSRVRETRTPGSVRAKAKWLSYSTIPFSRRRPTHAYYTNFDHSCCGRDHAHQRIDLYPVEGSTFAPQSLFT